MVLHEEAVGLCGSTGDPRLETGRRPPAPRLVHELAVGRVKREDAVRAVAVTQVDVLGIRWGCKPRGDVRRLVAGAATGPCRAHVWATRHVLPKGALFDPHRLSLQRRLGQLGRVVRVVQVLGLALGCDFEAVRGARAQFRGVLRGKLAAAAVRVPPNDAVRIVPAVLVRQNDVLVLVDRQAVAVDHLGARRRLQKVGHVLVSVLALTADDGPSLA
mmetsp:Transcript_15424/g.39837  ORF Transcript_15424/g.39837 Transcript_15424/m.39837 type:complete len:216 (-) Transcript_15424:242-889(-)